MIRFNRVILAGNLTRDPEFRYSSRGLAVTVFPLAANYRYRVEKEIYEDVCYIDVVTFGRVAENCRDYLEKGSPVLVEGRLRQRSWTNFEGEKKSKHEVDAFNVQFLKRREEEDSQDKRGGGKSEEKQGEGETQQ